MLLELLMVSRDMGWRCDRWEPRVRPEPTSTVHAQSGKMRPVSLAVITGAVVYYSVPNGTLVYSSQVISLYDCRCTIQPHLAWTLYW